MEQRKLGRTGIDVGVIGLGTEHLEKDAAAMDQVMAMAVEAGSNYVDLLYIDPRGSDAPFWQAFAPALRPRRKDMVLAAHWGGGPRYDLPYCRRCFDDLLAYACDGYAEVAMMTMAVDGDRWSGWAQESFDILGRYKDQGRIGWIGASGHDPLTALAAVESGRIDVLMFQVNMIGADVPAQLALYDACHNHDVALVAMKVYSGGTLLVLDGRPTGITPAQCLSYALSVPVATTVPGPRNVAEWRATLGYLSVDEMARAHVPALGGLHDTFAGHCVYCDHCMPCPEGILIGTTIMYADWGSAGVNDELRQWYAKLPVPASACTQCGLCTSRCPFHVDAVARIRRAAELFEG